MSHRVSRYSLILAASCGLSPIAQDVRMRPLSTLGGEAQSFSPTPQQGRSLCRDEAGTIRLGFSRSYGNYTREDSNLQPSVP
jgi:hypothetical protein